MDGKRWVPVDCSKLHAGREPALCLTDECLGNLLKHFEHAQSVFAGRVKGGRERGVTLFLELNDVHVTYSVVGLEVCFGGAEEDFGSFGVHDDLEEVLGEHVERLAISTAVAEDGRTGTMEVAG